ncbi:hypothetical protein DIPPA_15026 [Diplonema papillatum]|nr:hypothetical protein DIPPA_15026 [Diplonema papillatum]
MQHMEREVGKMEQRLADRMDRRLEETGRRHAAEQEASQKVFLADLQRLIGDQHTQQQQQLVALLKADIVVLQETRVTRVEKAFLSSFLAAYGWNVHWGDDVARVEGRDGRTQRRPGGVAVMTLQHLTAQRVAPKDESEKKVEESTRMVHVAIALRDGRTALHVFSV